MNDRILPTSTSAAQLEMSVTSVFWPHWQGREAKSQMMKTEDDLFNRCCGLQLGHKILRKFATGAQWDTEKINLKKMSNDQLKICHIWY
jgi:hypothetical protein